MYKGATPVHPAPVRDVPGECCPPAGHDQLRLQLPHLRHGVPGVQVHTLQTSLLLPEENSFNESWIRINV